MILKQLDFIVFDIESDTNQITEIAWQDINNEYNFIHENVHEGILKFKEELSSNRIIIGHNILEFDLPVLQNLEQINFDKNMIWDTFQVEKVLSPELKTYALNCPHIAIEDVKHTYELFKNQFFRILELLNGKTNHLEGILPIEIISQLLTLRTDFEIELTFDSLNVSKTKFFRPQPKANTLIEKLFQKIDQSKALKKIILGEESAVSEILSSGKVIFSVNFLDKIDFQIINREKVFYSSILEKSQKAQILSFIDYCIDKKMIPYWGNVSPSTRNFIDGKIDVWTLFEEKFDEILELNYPKFNLANNMDEYFSIHHKMKHTELFVLQPDLISISQKELIKKVEIEQLKALFKENYFWMKFSGGQSVISITKEDVQKLVTKNIDIYENLWIEKYQYGQYRIYGNKSWEKIISDLKPFDRITNIELDSEKFKSDHVICVKFKPTNKSEYNVTRFNPESIYRSRYWVIQSKIIDQIVSKGDSILLIQRYEEIDLLTRYFEEKGYYIPKIDISLGRRIELLHRQKKQKKIIIAHLNDADFILKLNHSEPINLIIDSFNLVDPYYCSQGSTFFNEKMAEGTFKKDIESKEENLLNENEEDSDLNSGNKKDVFLQDNYFLLKLLRPRITHLRNLLQIDNTKNKLWLLDPRIEDFHELGKQWNVGREYIDGWDSKEEYDSDVATAEKFVSSPKPSDIPFSVEESMEIIRKVFIPQERYRPEQIPYLENILKSEDDWLILLPTGGGKSILFQGPAILKSAFTNRLTLVVTPLKALMEDQVNKLWEKGFYGNVDFLNSDRSSDTELIYRSIAGGELSLLFVTPERFRSKGFLNAIESRVQNDGGLEYFVFDEAHCVSQWGQDFRPDYFNCAKQIWRTKINSEYKTPLLLFSATVSKKIIQDFNTIFHD